MVVQNDLINTVAHEAVETEVNLLDVEEDEVEVIERMPKMALAEEKDGLSEGGEEQTWSTKHHLPTKSNRQQTRVN